MLPEKIRTLRKSKNEDDRRECLRELAAYLSANPNDTAAWYLKASCHDFLGEELEAEPCYARVLAARLGGLQDEEKPGFYVGYGSTLRNNGKLDVSEKVLREGAAGFPDYPAIQIFLAFTLHSLGHFDEAARLLFKAAPNIAARGLDGYERAVAHYADEL